LLTHPLSPCLPTPSYSFFATFCWTLQVSLATLYQLYATRRRTKNVRTRRSFKRKDVECAPNADVSEDLREDSDYSDCEDSDVEEVLEGEIFNFQVPTEPYKQVLCVNTSLKKMDKGKAMAQCGHATLGAYRLAEKYAPANVRHWLMFGQAKIAVKCTEEQMLAVAEHAKRLGVVSYTVEDAGRTQIPAGSKTVCAIGPAPQSLLDEITGSFKLM
jgi:peptidyl-tRNA hydrolase, PTH2 family